MLLSDGEASRLNSWNISEQNVSHVSVFLCNYMSIHVTLMLMLLVLFVQLMTNFAILNERVNPSASDDLVAGLSEAVASLCEVTQLQETVIQSQNDDEDMSFKNNGTIIYLTNIRRLHIFIISMQNKLLTQT